MLVGLAQPAFCALAASGKHERGIGIEKEKPSDRGSDLSYLSRDRRRVCD